MKKIIFSALMMTGLVATSFAQTAKPATPAAKPPVVTTKTATTKPAATTTTTTAKPVFKTTTSTQKVVAKPAEKAPVAAPAVNPTTGVVLKKDGTADKRYKNATPAAGPTKKDGSADMRYKANKKP